MSDSAKKKQLKQMRLPFSVLPTDKTASSSPKAFDNASPKTPSVSRKRKPSGDNESGGRLKIGRVAAVKENVESKDCVEIVDSDEEAHDDVKDVSKNQSIIAAPNDNETTPTTVAGQETVLHIKLPSCSKSKRKINMDSKPPKSIDEEDKDDSVVYLDEEEIRESCKKTKKSSKKSEKKKKAATSSEANRVKKNLQMSKTIEEIDDDAKKEDSGTTQSNKNPEEIAEQPMEVDDVEPTVAVETSIKEAEKSDVKIDEIDDENNPVPSKMSPLQEPDSIHDEIIDMLSDDSDGSGNRISPLNENGDRKSGAKLDFSKLTPKQQARRKEQEARRAEKELLRLKERDQKEQQRLKEKEQRDEAKRKEKEEKEEARKREKEERDRKRQAEQDKKDEEKRVKEEERKRIVEQRDEEKRQKEEDRKRQIELKEEEKRRREDAQKKKEIEEENRKKRASEALMKFFVPKKKAGTPVADDENSKDSAKSADSVVVAKNNFMSFQIRDRMMLAPRVRLHITKEQIETLDENLKRQKPLDGLYLNLLKTGAHKPGKSDNTWPTEEKDEDDDVVAIEDELEGVGEDIQVDENKITMKHRSKFLKFDENRRPPYHGTWRKKSGNVSARRPFAQDSKFFDYEVDSDDEWEEEEPGESLHGSESENEKDKEEEDDYDIDNDFFVPHGHLSDEEMQQMDDDVDNHPEAQKAKLKILQQEFAAEMKKKTEKIKPRLIGCIWMNGDEDENGYSKVGHEYDKKYHCTDIIWRILKAREMMTSEDGVKLEENLEPDVAEIDDTPAQPKTPAQNKTQQRAKITGDVSIKELIKLLHGNINSRRFIVREYQAYRLKNYHNNTDYQEYSIKSVDEKVAEISVYKTCPDEGPMFGKKCWYVKPEVTQEYYAEGELKLPNEWVYILEKEVKEKKPKQPTIDATKKDVSQEKSPPEVKPEVVVVAKPKEVVKPKEVAKPLPTPPQAGKKRVALLMSGPRGQALPEAKKSTLMSQFLKINNQPSTKPAKSENQVEEVIEID